MHQRLFVVVVAVAAIAAVACSESSRGRLNFAVSTHQTPATYSATTGTSTTRASVVMAGESTVVALGTDTVILRSAELVVRKVELKKSETEDCDDSEATEDCAEIKAGPVLVELPIGSVNIEALVSVAAPAGQYDALEFKIHPPKSPDDDAFIAANPGFTGLSVKVTGTFSHAGTRSDFTFTSDLDAKQKVELSPSLVVTEGTPANLTLRFDISTWFMTETRDALIDPASANVGGANEALVKENIKGSIRAFHDDDHDGKDDDHEEPDEHEGGGS